MTSIEELLKSQAETEIHLDETFRFKLRHDRDHRLRAKQRRGPGQPLLALALAVTLVLLTTVVVKPGLANATHDWLFDGGHRQAQLSHLEQNPGMIPIEQVMEPILDGFSHPNFAKPQPVAGLGNMVREETIIVRHFQLENGEKAIVFFRPQTDGPKTPYKIY